MDHPTDRATEPTLADNHQQYSHGATQPTWYLHAADYHSSLRISSGTTLGCGNDGELTFSADGATDAVRFDIIEHKLWVTRLVGDAVLEEAPVHRYAQVPERARLTIGPLRVRISSDLEALPETSIVIREPRQDTVQATSAGTPITVAAPAPPPPVTATRAPQPLPPSRDNAAYGPLTAFVCALLFIVGVATWWFSSGRDQLEHQVQTQTQSQAPAAAPAQPRDPAPAGQQSAAAPPGESEPVAQPDQIPSNATPTDTAAVDTEPVDTAASGITLTDTASANTAAAPPAQKIDAVTQRRLSSLEQRLERQLRDGYLTLPADNNAVATARLILQLDPGNASAMDAMSDSAQRLLSAALEAQASGLDYEARNLIEEILAFHPTHAGALQAWAEIQRQP